jgi:hypothetical protein
LPQKNANEPVTSLPLWQNSGSSLCYIYGSCNTALSDDNYIHLIRELQQQDSLLYSGACMHLVPTIDCKITDPVSLTIKFAFFVGCINGEHGITDVVIAHVGDSVTLRCHSNDEHFIWEYRAHELVKDPSDVCVDGVIINGFKLRFNITGHCSLQTDSVTLNDAGLYDHVGDGGYAGNRTRIWLQVYGMF